MCEVARSGENAFLCGIKVYRFSSNSTSMTSSG